MTLSFSKSSLSLSLNKATPLCLATFLVVSPTITFSSSFYSSPPPVMLATDGQDVLINPLNEYWASEKLDGIRAYWNGKNLMTRNGNRIHAPKWFTTQFPSTHLDGELWIERQAFEKTLSIVSKETPIDDEWQQIRFMVFDLPQSTQKFEQRLQHLSNIITSAGSSYLKCVKHTKIDSSKKLDALLDRITLKGGEGLMLRKTGSLYRQGRNDELLKIKKYQDAEAQVVAYTLGKGRLKNKMGAIIVQRPDGLKFKVGTGFSDELRQSPPEIGSTITYKHYGFTKNGIPRFASFMRVRRDEKF